MISLPYIYIIQKFFIKIKKDRITVRYDNEYRGGVLWEKINKKYVFLCVAAQIATKCFEI